MITPQSVSSERYVVKYFLRLVNVLVQIKVDRSRRWRSDFKEHQVDDSAVGKLKLGRVREPFRGDSTHL